jgi:hypothetical protein
MEMTTINTFFVLFGLLIGIFIGYLMCGIRLKSYLKKYYPEVDFQQSPKERKQILKERENKKDENTDDIVDDYLSQNKKI